MEDHKSPSMLFVRFSFFLLGTVLVIKIITLTTDFENCHWLFIVYVAMDKGFSSSLLLLLLLMISSLVISVYGIDGEYVHCNCDDDDHGIWSVQSILVCQKVSDFFIAIAYFSIPLELLYFVSYSNVPFKLVFLQFVAFIVLCGLTHLLNAYTYYGLHSFQLFLSLTVAKFLTALVSDRKSVV